MERRAPGRRDTEPENRRGTGRVGLRARSPAQACGDKVHDRCQQSDRREMEERTKRTRAVVVMMVAVI